MFVKSAFARSGRIFTTINRSYSSNASARDYTAAVTLLNSVASNHATRASLAKAGEDMNARSMPEMKEWLRKIGYEPFDLNNLNAIHIAGTNGKGSTATYVSSILSHYCDHVGLYTSPHLRSVRERISINNQQISEAQFAESFFSIWDKISTTDVKPAHFRLLTLLAFHTFLKEGIQPCVIEAGIGGEYDCTNIIPQPALTGITSLSLDHTDMLGPTQADIAWHKAGIFKSRPGALAFTVQQPQEAMAVLHTRAKEKGVEIIAVPTHPELAEGKVKLFGTTHNPAQWQNASLAIALAASYLRGLRFKDVPNPYAIEYSHLPEKFITGLESARLPGRAEVRTVGRGMWYVDGAHTKDSVAQTGEWFASAVKDRSQSAVPRVLIFNQQTRDAVSLLKKLYEATARALHTQQPFSHVIFCTSLLSSAAQRHSGEPTSMHSTNDEAVLTLSVQRACARWWADKSEGTAVSVVRTVDEAVSFAKTIIGGGEGDVLCTGSLHLVGGITEVLEH